MEQIIKRITKSIGDFTSATTGAIIVAILAKRFSTPMAVETRMVGKSKTVLK